MITLKNKTVTIELIEIGARINAIVVNGVDIAHEVRMGDDAVMFVRDCNGVLIEFIQQPK